MRRRSFKMPGTSLLKKAAVLALALVLALPAAAIPAFASESYTVTVAKGYLALRNAKAYNDANEIGQLKTGDTVEVSDTNGTYWTVYSSRLGLTGYVNRAYLANSSGSRTVEVSSGYLALRSAKSYNSSNEVGKLYDGDTVQIANTKDDTYWLVYAPDLGKGGYVNKNYLSDSETVTYPTRTVKVKSGYLALRSARAYDSANEIGRLYNGDTVEIRDSSSADYWYVYSSKLDKSGYVNKNYLY